MNLGRLEGRTAAFRAAPALALDRKIEQSYALSAASVNLM